MKATYGAFDRALASSLDHLQVTFRAGPMRMRWIHCGLTADLFSAYYAAEIEDGHKHDSQRLNRAEMTGCIRYAINEVLENAVKFHRPGEITIQSKIVYTSVVILISNLTSASQAATLKTHLEGLMVDDLDQLMRERIEASVRDGSTSSGIGYLTLMNDYDAVLGWSLESVNDDDVLVETMIRLSLYKKNDTVVDSVGFHRKL